MCVCVCASVCLSACMCVCVRVRSVADSYHTEKSGTYIILCMEPDYFSVKCVGTSKKVMFSYILALWFKAECMHEINVTI